MANNAFGIILNTQLDTKKADQQLKAFTKSREIITTIKIKDPETKQVETAIKKVSTLVDEVSNKSAKKVEIFDLDGNKISSEVKSVTDSFKNLVTATNDYKAGIRDVSTETEKSKEAMNGLSVDVSKVSKTYTDAAGNTQKVIETTRTWVDENNKLHTSIEKTDGAGNQLAPTINKIADNEQQLVTETKKADGVFGLLSSRFTAVNIASRLIQEGLSKVKKAVGDAIEIVKEYDAALTEMSKVSSYSGDQLREYAERLGEVGLEVAKSRTQMVDASTGWLKAGETEESAEALSKYSALLANTSDEAMDCADATAILVSQIRGFGEELENAYSGDKAKFAEHIDDAINKVSADFAVSSGDISKGLTQAGASAATFGNTFDQTIGLITSGTEVFQGKSAQVARGLNMIETRVAKSDEALAKYGVAVKDSSGELRSTYDILKDLAPKWKEMSDAEKTSLGQTLAGTQQYKILAAILNNFDTAIAATEDSMNSMGETAKQNEAYMNSLEAKTALLKSGFEKLVLGDGGLQELGKSLADIGVKVLDFANTDIGKLSIAISGLVLGIGAAAKAMGGFNAMFSGNVITSAIASLISGEATLAGVTGTLTTAFIDNALAWAATPMGMATLVAGSILALAVTAEKFNTSLDNQTKKFEEVGNAYKQAQGDVKSLESELEDVRKKIDEINKQGGAQTSDKAQLAELEKQEAALIRQLALKKQILEQTQKEAEEEAKKTLNQSQVYVGKDTGLTDTNIQMESTVAIEKATKAYSDNQIQIDSLTESLKTYIDENGNVIEGYEEVVDKTNARIDSLQEEQDSVSELANEIVEDYSAIIDGLPDGEIKDKLEGFIDGWLNVTGATEEAKDNLEGTGDTLDELGDSISEAEAELEALAEAHDVTVDALKEMAKEIGMSEEELLNYADAMGVTVQQAYEYQSAVQGWNSAIDSLQASYSTLTDAVDEYNSTGEISLDTLQALLELSPEYLSMLSEENGKLVLNEEAIVNKCNALIEERKQTAMQIAMEKLAAIETGTNTSAISNQTGTIYSNVDALNEESNALNINSARQYANKIAREGGKAKASAANKVIKELESELKMIDKLGSQYGKVSTSAIKSGGSRAKASGGAKKAIDSESKALENLKSNYERVISYINKRYDSKINALQKEKSSALDNVQDEIDAINKEKEAALDSIEKVIKAREKEKKAALDSINAQINALKKEQDARIGGLKGQRNDLKKAEDDEIKALEKKIKLLQTEKKAVEKETQAEIDALKKLQDERTKYWDDQINALKASNDQRQDAIELQEKLDALEAAKAQKVKVYKQGEGFVYDTDRTKVAEAQKDLDEYLSQKAYEDELARLEDLKAKEIDNYSARIDALNDFKDAQSENYQKQIDDLTTLKETRQAVYEEELEALDELIEQEQEKYDAQMEILEERKEYLEDYYEQELDALKEQKEALQEQYEERIDALNDYKDELEDNYDAQIDAFQNYKDQFEDMVNAYEDEQDRLLFEQLTGLSAENSTWMTRLENLASFVNTYNSLLRQLDSGTTNASASGYSGSSSPSYSSGVSKSTASKSSSHSTLNGSAYNYNSTSHSTLKGSAYAYASGVDSVPDDQIALVGENPAHRELVIGSKINNGQMMSLGKGTGVVNAKSTKSMAGLLNTLGQYGASAFGAGGGTLTNNTTSTDNSFNINGGISINGAGIVDPQSFKTALENFKNSAIQRAYKK